MKRPLHWHMVFGALLIALGGCSSSTPGTKDIEAELNNYWSTCKGLEVFDVEKTNGVDKGDSYLVYYRYKLRLLKDLNPKMTWNDGVICPDHMMMHFLGAIELNGISADKAKKGSVAVVEGGKLIMVRSENGWMAK